MWQWENKEMKDRTRGGAIIQEKREGGQEWASKEGRQGERWLRRLPASPPFQHVFFPYESFLLLLHYSPKKHCFSARNGINQHSPLQHGSRSALETPCPIGAAPGLLSQSEWADEAGVTATCFLTPLCKFRSHTRHGGCRGEATAEGRFGRMVAVHHFQILKEI